MRNGMTSTWDGFPESLRTVGDRAFGNARALASIVFPEGVTSIGSDVFPTCDTNRSVTLPRSLESIGEDAFGFGVEYNVYRGSYAATWCEEQQGNHGITYLD